MELRNKNLRLFTATGCDLEDLLQHQWQQFLDLKTRVLQLEELVDKLLKEKGA